MGATAFLPHWPPGGVDAWILWPMGDIPHDLCEIFRAQGGSRRGGPVGPVGGRKPRCHELGRGSIAWVGSRESGLGHGVSGLGKVGRQVGCQACACHPTDAALARSRFCARAHPRVRCSISAQPLPPAFHARPTRTSSELRGPGGPRMMPATQQQTAEAQQQAGGQPGGPPGASPQAQQGQTGVQGGAPQPAWPKVAPPQTKVAPPQTLVPGGQLRANHPGVRATEAQAAPGPGAAAATSQGSAAANGVAPAGHAVHGRSIRATTTASTAGPAPGAAAATTVGSGAPVRASPRRASGTPKGPGRPGSAEPRGGPVGQGGAHERAEGGHHGSSGVRTLHAAVRQATGAGPGGHR